MRARLPLLLGMAALVLIVVVASRGSSPVHLGEHGLLFGTHNPPPPPPPTQDQNTNPVLGAISAIGLAGLLLLVLALLLFGLSLIIVNLIGTRSRRSRLASPVLPSDADDAVSTPGIGVLRDGVRAARQALTGHTSGPPGDAVIAAWVRLEHTAAESGHARAPHQTPTEFTADVLTGHLGPLPAVDRLRTLYQRARFGRAGTVTAADAAAAADALTGILHAFDRTGR